MLRECRQLVGAKITNLIQTPAGEDDQMFGFTANLASGKSVDVWVQCDPEGNGPGWLNIEREDQ